MTNVLNLFPKVIHCFGVGFGPVLLNVTCVTFFSVIECVLFLLGEFDLELCRDCGLELELFVGLAQTGAICPKMPQI